jgi:ankyrin repeat protein
VSLTPSGNTALILAASKNSNEALQLLLEAGAELEHRNATGNTALIVATAADAYDAADALIAAGANPKLRNNQFESAKSIAEKRNDSRWQNLLAGASSPGLLGIFD